MMSGPICFYEACISESRANDWPVADFPLGMLQYIHREAGIAESYDSSNFTSFNKSLGGKRKLFSSG